MAGPTAGVLVAGLPADLSWCELMTGIADQWLDPSFCWISDSAKFGGTFLGEPRPFVGGVHTIQQDKFCGLSLEQCAAVSRATNKAFTHVVELGAMSKSAADHRLLCEIARCLAARHDGYVDFCGIVTNRPCQGLITVHWLEEDTEMATQLGTPDACEWWLRQDTFHMIK